MCGDDCDDKAGDKFLEMGDVPVLQSDCAGLYHHICRISVRQPINRITGYVNMNLGWPVWNKFWPKLRFRTSYLKYKYIACVSANIEISSRGKIWKPTAIKKQNRAIAATLQKKNSKNTKRNSKFYLRMSAAAWQSMKPVTTVKISCSWTSTRRPNKLNTLRKKNWSAKASRMSFPASSSSAFSMYSNGYIRPAHPNTTPFQFTKMKGSQAGGKTTSIDCLRDRSLPSTMTSARENVRN